MNKTPKFAMPNTRVGYLEADCTSFVETLRETCHLCLLCIDRTKPVAILPCCNRGVHLYCAIARYDASEGCPLCWSNDKYDQTPDIILPLDFLSSTHAFLVANQWYYVFKDRSMYVDPWISTPKITKELAASYQEFLWAHRKEIFETLGPKIEKLAESVGYSVDFIDLFYWDILTSKYRANNKEVWTRVLDCAARERCQTGNAFNLLFRVLDGDVPLIKMRRLSKEQRAALGVGPPQWRQLFPTHVDALEAIEVEPWEPIDENAEE